MKSPSLIAFLVLTLLSAANAQQEVMLKKFAGTYITGHDFGGGFITLNEDGAFSESGGSDDGTEIASSGTYRISNATLVFSVKSKTLSQRDERKVNLLDPKEVTSEKIEKEFTLLPVEWSGRIYLLYEAELDEFANAVNLGIEPRQTLQSHYDVSPWFGSFYLRKGDQKKQVRGKPDLPKDWLAFLLDRPLSARVIKVESVKQEKYGIVSTVIINKGAKDGLKVGMRLIANKEIPTLSEGTSVISVARTRAKLEAVLNRPLRVGERIRSRYEPSPFLKHYWMLQEQDG